VTAEPPTSPPEPAASRRRRVRRIFIVVGVTLTCLALLCCAGVGYIVYDAHRAPGERHDMEAFGESLCQHLVAGDAGAVYADLSADARHRYSPEELSQGLTAVGGLTRCEVVRATYLFLLLAYVVIEDGTGQHSFDLVEEAGEWRVDSDILHDLANPPSHGGGGGGGFDD
jgi:hypothetical protein